MSECRYCDAPQQSNTRGVITFECGTRHRLSTKSFKQSTDCFKRHIYQEDLINKMGLLGEMWENCAHLLFSEIPSVRKAGEAEYIKLKPLSTSWEQCEQHANRKV